MSHYAYAKIYFDEITPNLLLKSFLWIDKQRTHYDSTKKKWTATKPKKYRYRITIGEKTASYGSKSSRLFIVNIDPKSIKLFKEINRLYHEHYYTLRSGEGFFYRGKKVLEERYKILCDEINGEISKKIHEYKNVKDFFSECENAQTREGRPFHLFETSIDFLFTNEYLKKYGKMEPILELNERRHSFSGKEGVSINYNFIIEPDCIMISPSWHDYIIPQSKLIRKKLIGLCKSIKAEKGVFAYVSIDKEEQFYP